MNLGLSAIEMDIVQIYTLKNFAGKFKEHTWVLQEVISTFLIKLFIYLWSLLLVLSEESR